MLALLKIEPRQDYKEKEAEIRSDLGWRGGRRWFEKVGAIRELNPGPPVPETGIIPLDQSPKLSTNDHAILNHNLTQLYLHTCDIRLPSFTSIVMLHIVIS